MATNKADMNQTHTSPIQAPNVNVRARMSAAEAQMPQRGGGQRRALASASSQSSPSASATLQGGPSASATLQANASGAGMSNTGIPSPEHPQKGTSKRTFIIVAIIVIAALLIWLCVWLFACGGPSMFDPNARDGQAPYKSAEEMQAELDRVVDEGMFNISIASAIQFDDGTSPGTAYIENVPGNHYLMRVSITEDATGDLLYESGVLKPNQFIEEIALAKDLDAGTYPATATFTALDETTHEETGQAAAKININVLN